MTHPRWFGFLVASVAALSASTASADPTVDVAEKGPFDRAEAPNDPTGGAYTTPTLLFTPAAGVPAWNVRVITSLDMQGPTPPDRLAIGTNGPNAAVGFQPGVAAEVGLPARFTLGVGTNWVGGDPNNLPNVAGGLSPYFQLRYFIIGDQNRGRGFLLGTSATYKFVGFGGNGPGNPQDPGEMEWAVSAQVRERFYEVGLQGVVGKDFATRAADSEVHAYALVRPVAPLGLGVASQLRVALVQPPGGPQPFGDVIAGGIASLTVGRWQLGLLGGESTVGLASGATMKVGALGEVFGTARF